VLFNFYRTASMQSSVSHEQNVCLSICLSNALMSVCLYVCQMLEYLFVCMSVKCLNCDKTKETYANIYMPQEWLMHLVFVT